MVKVKATVHGAISLVNAIATQKGATLGIELKVDATVEATPGKGINILSENKSLSSRLINKTIIIKVRQVPHMVFSGMVPPCRYPSAR